MIYRIGFVLVLTIVALIISFTSFSESQAGLPQILFPVIVAVLGALFAVIERRFAAQNGKRVIIGFFLMILGGGFGYLLGSSIEAINPEALKIYYIPLFLQLIFIYLGMVLGLLKADEFNIGGIAKDRKQEAEGAVSKILDTSVIIDGRVADIAETGFLDGVLIIPKFVLNELQQVADSSDPLKRSRGRRGLDILNNMKASKKAIIKISDLDFPEIKEVDSKLLRLAKETGSIVITNDFNLNKLAEFQGVRVLNVNQLSNAVKPIVLPNEELRITIIKEGKDSKQGIAYLDDGTMIVVDNGRDKIGREVDVVVTSILQTPAGRMIFTQLADDNQQRRN